MKLLLFTVIVAVSTIGCSENSATPTGPSVFAPVASHELPPWPPSVRFTRASVADDTPTGLEDNQCNSNAPTELSANVNNSKVDLVWRPVWNVEDYELEFERFNGRNVWEIVDRVVLTPPAVWRGATSADKYRVRIRGRRCHGEGQWSDFVQFSIDSPPPALLPPISGGIPPPKPLVKPDLPLGTFPTCFNCHKMA